MKFWEYGSLKVGKTGRYLVNGDKPFFWLGDTAWLLFQKCGLEESRIYLKNRRDKGFTVIQAVLIPSVPEASIKSGISVDELDVRTPEYWEHCDRIIRTAEEHGMYMALLPTWGSLVKSGILDLDNIEEYMLFLSERYKDNPNIIWLLGGDIRAAGYEELYNKAGRILKERDPDKLIGYHPFGRTSSSMWFHDAEWLDFNMFQSGHRRYDQADLGKWDDNSRSESFFGEDNWKYVDRDLGLSPLKPTVDGEPSYEWIPQGLHDPNEPYWQAQDVRRYAYWSVFQGAMGHTYGDNAIMQFYRGGSDKGNYGVKESWRESLHHSGSGQTGYLRRLMESVDYQSGAPAEEALASGQKEKYERVSVFAGEDFMFAYTYSGKPFELDISALKPERLDTYWLDPSTGIYSYAGDVETKSVVRFVPPKRYSDANDWVLVLRKPRAEAEE